MPSLNDVLAGSQAQAVQVQQIVDALKGTPNKGVPVALVAINDSANYALTVQNNDPVNSRALSVLKADGTTLISADATGVTLGSPVNTAPGSIPGTGLANGSVANAALGPDVARANQLVNGGFEIWQRGVGPFSTNGLYSADRWLFSLAGTDTLSVSRDAVNIDTGSQACAACTFVLGTGGGGSSLTAPHKMADGYQLRGRTVSLSVRVKTSTANAVRGAIGYDGTGAGTINTSFHTGGGVYQTLTCTATIPPDATLVYSSFVFAASCTAYLDNASLVVGSQPANYVPLHPADDLARCLRYYEILGQSTSTIVYQVYAAAGASINFPLPYKVTKAVTPTVTKVGTWGLVNCAQPTLPVAGLDTTYIASVVTALGMAQFYNNAPTGVTVEANP